MERSLFLLSVWALTSILALLVAAEDCTERILVNERKRTCPKNCKQDKDCGSKRQCLCDGQCGLSCVVPSRTCPWPMAPGNHSEAHLLSPTPSFSALLEVRCLPGYTMSNGLDAAIRRCQGDRQWSGDEPVCTALPSPPPFVVDAGPVLSCELQEPDVSLVIVEGEAAVGASVRYSCPTGYVLFGNSENFCHSNQTWHYPHPICQRMFCPPPAEVENGYLVAVQRKEYDVGDTIYYLCKKTFSLDGPNRVTCLSNGTWSTIPFCRDTHRNSVATLPWKHALMDSFKHQAATWNPHGCSTNSSLIGLFQKLTRVALLILLTCDITRILLILVYIAQSVQLCKQKINMFTCLMFTCLSQLKKIKKRSRMVGGTALLK
ncbi:beta-2-glycoprotein 1-like isoform X1 [Alosa alosa]|uniref:beta-2-glycoprotein 1-like isoform X1 n=1 Tax=Alosa alosa TaxID=278164 RepID=UPI0020150E1D|nr:beta-2-glycoprotein 1-like isoform X1 [Alosa alosa]